MTFVKKKITTLSLIKGNKNTSEKNLLNTLKKIQVNYSNKKSKDILKLSLRNHISLFRFHKFKQKKVKTEKTVEIPGFIRLKQARSSVAVKTILTKINLDKKKKFTEKFFNEIVLNAKTRESNSTKEKSELYSKVFMHRHLFKYYRLT